MSKENVEDSSLEKKSKQNLLRVVDLHHKYSDIGKGTKKEINKEINVLKEINFVISKGEFVAIVGKSGSGKSTLLNLISGIEHLQKGQVYLEETNLASLSDKKITAIRKNKIGFIFQQYHLLNELNVLENVMLPMMQDFGLREDIKNRAKELLGKVGLIEKIYRSIGELSGGEMQRVGIARALINKPILLIADEPTGNLDAANSIQIFDFLYSLCKSDNITVLMVTHNRELSLRCDKIFYLNHGNLKKVKYSKKK